MKTLHTKISNEINRIRKASGNSWYEGEFWVEYSDKTTAKVRFKGYKTWLQVLTIDGMQAGFPEGLSVLQFRDRLDRLFPVTIRDYSFYSVKS